MTGHTGFKGGWLCLVLKSLGADVCGVALEPESHPSFFEVAGVARDISSVLQDIRELSPLEAVFRRVNPQIIFHLAAQPLVRASYLDPVGTYATNVMGTVHVLEAARSLPCLQSVIVVTSDKCYENHEWEWGYRETDPVGGFDPYSSSKGCAELVAAAWARSFFNNERSPRLATARAGNVIGGGDWAADRLVPDAIRAFSLGDTLRIRYPAAIRPWQHVLEPICGYVMLAEHIISERPGFAGGWNFGPCDNAVQTVREIVEKISRLWGDGAEYTVDGAAHPHEAGFLKLDCSKAARRLGWRPRLDLDTALEWTVAWHRAMSSAEDMHHFTLRQVSDYFAK